MPKKRQEKFTFLSSPARKTTEHEFSASTCGVSQAYYIHDYSKSNDLSLRQNKNNTTKQQDNDNVDGDDDGHYALSILIFYKLGNVPCYFGNTYRQWCL